MGALPSVPPKHSEEDMGGGGQVLMYVFQDSTVGTQQSGDGGAGP